MDGDDSSKGWNRLSDVAPTLQGTKGEDDLCNIIKLLDKICKKQTGLMNLLKQQRH